MNETEKMIYALLLTDMPGTKIPDEIGIHSSLAKFHISRVYEFFGVRSRISLIIKHYSSIIRP